MLLGDVDTFQLETELDEFSDNWYIGLETDPEWAENIVRERPNLFSISRARVNGDSGQTVYRSHLLTMRECGVAVGRLNHEVVRSLWASLSLELLYLTNDDEER